MKGVVFKCSGFWIIVIGRAFILLFLLTPRKLIRILAPHPSYPQAAPHTCVEDIQATRVLQQDKGQTWYFHVAVSYIGPLSSAVYMWITGCILLL